ncbi:hypothetical protein J2T17_003009 [Paenibacillus mucilaginosus]|uniref:hypothetical protein n=1 Tax=Paenibacillus mucilaginosus TaxID=61624 RepID=UPI003D23283E
MKIVIHSLIDILILWPSLFILGLSLFRQKLNPYFTSILISTFVMSTVSLIVHNTFLEPAMTLIQPIFLILCFYLILRLSLLHSTIICITTYIFSALVELTLMALLSNMNWDRFVQGMQEYNYIQGTTIGLLNYWVAWLLYKTRFGFTFIHVRQRQVGPSAANSRVSYILVPAFFYMAALSLVIFHLDQFLLINLAFLVAALLFLLIWMYKRERSE